MDNRLPGHQPTKNACHNAAPVGEDLWHMLELRGYTPSVRLLPKEKARGCEEEIGSVE